jgi:hypothetical protein
MRTEQDGSTRPSHPRHIFAPEYLAWLAERDEPHTAPEADSPVPGIWRSTLKAAGPS